MKIVFCLYFDIYFQIYEKENADAAPIPDLSLANDSDDESSYSKNASPEHDPFISVKIEPLDEDEQYFLPSTASDKRPEFNPNHFFLPRKSSKIVVPGPPVPVMLPDGYAPRFDETRREHAPETAPATVRMYECTICNCRFKSLTLLNMHIKKHSKKCRKCGLKFNRFDLLQKHRPYCMHANGV